ncbi:FMN-binding negative transcriptional regulator [Sediminitomix flava]|uniref:PaiB family negative transcriptional regulator n=1 Tax=Sediminitomix flava TaxID=379075 RepID=A0A315ZI40_SEDFL|nr:FMN-binding negative transcriptional regulator [Sediminitomix flava]PWJ44770.1 PaiB family negative transcriptional regulator [Sediminitomix flava]
MYPPKHYQETDFSNIIACIRQFPFATLISVEEGESYITHLPLMYKTDDQGNGKLVGHLDRNNPHAAFFKDKKIKVIFHGPSEYISPTYMTTSQLPTWNYVKVHVEGTTREITAAEDVKTLMVEMTEFLEKSDQPFELDYNDPRMEKYLPYILGFEISIEKWEGKFKLSQDKSPIDRQKTKEAMFEKSTEGLKEFLDTVYGEE